MEQLNGRVSICRRQRQAGVVLFIALIALVVMTVGAVALMRSGEIANIIAGNFSFKQSSLNVSDVGVEAAVTAVPGIAAGAADSVFPAGCTTSCSYYPVMGVLDASGKPTSVTINGTTRVINWNNLPNATSPLAGYTVSYVIERLCTGAVPVTNIVDNCLADSSDDGGSKRAGAVRFTKSSTLYYRVTVRVAGPRNTESFTQTILSY